MGTPPWQVDIMDTPGTPAHDISWYDVQDFIAKLNEAEGAEVYRLPTEAEWEYACRAGATTLWSFGDEVWMLALYAWYYDNTCAVEECYAHEVGTKLPNPWGLYDMHGNMIEWCQDWYSNTYYGVSPSVDPPGPTSGSLRVIRHWRESAWDTRSVSRDHNGPHVRGDPTGARLVRQGP